MVTSRGITKDNVPTYATAANSSMTDRAQRVSNHSRNIKMQDASSPHGHGSYTIYCVLQIPDWTVSYQFFRFSLSLLLVDWYIFRKTGHHGVMKETCQWPLLCLKASCYAPSWIAGAPVDPEL